MQKYNTSNKILLQLKENVVNQNTDKVKSRSIIDEKRKRKVYYNGKVIFNVICLISAEINLVSREQSKQETV